MTPEIMLIGTAATIGFVHTITGPDHYLPFAVLAKARKWSPIKTTGVILFCGIGHVSSSVIIGMIGIMAGLSLNLLANIEAVRGDVAAWMLMTLGIVYVIWGLYKAFYHKQKSLDEDEGKVNLTPWVLFMVFVFGPCEALIPIIMYPGAEHNILLAIGAVAVFSLFTIATMLAAVFLTMKGISFLPVEKLSRYSHAIAGFTIFICGALIVFAGL